MLTGGLHLRLIGSWNLADLARQVSVPTSGILPLTSYFWQLADVARQVSVALVSASIVRAAEEELASLGVPDDEVHETALGFLALRASASAKAVAVGGGKTCVNEVKACMTLKRTTGRAPAWIVLGVCRAVDLGSVRRLLHIHLHSQHNSTTSTTSTNLSRRRQPHGKECARGAGQDCGLVDRGTHLSTAGHMSIAGRWLRPRRTCSRMFAHDDDGGGVSSPSADRRSF